ncbi:MarR family winged helix-turn-helix transcriptional regulator [Jatrophihabitans endophyticus]|uniref:MarR family winged helix-turn-helix transcriptional regulator n=1 Tax=Jatrophihabitans endophyticus TaxID=1206085 RepID=UPI001F165CD3|nr:MarR family transcriptional regulator [Jatrophihabitans endophyticus]
MPSRSGPDRADRPDAQTYASSLAFLSSQIGARSAELFADRLSGLGMSPREFAVLSNLDNSRQPLNQQAIAEALGMHRNNVVALVDALEDKGWLRRHRASDDRRAFTLRPTAAGLRVLRRAHGIVADLDAVLAADLSDTQVTQLRNLLLDVAAHLGLAAGVHPHLAARRRR